MHLSGGNLLRKPHMVLMENVRGFITPPLLPVSPLVSHRDPAAVKCIDSPVCKMSCLPISAPSLFLCYTPGSCPLSSLYIGVGLLIPNF